MPKTIKPMLCRHEDKAFNDPNYLWEPKMDGARIITVVKGGQVRLFSRSGKEKTDMYPDLKIETSTDAILDGEVEAGANFNDLQHRLSLQSGVDEATKEYPARYSVFDVLEVGDVNLRNVPLLARKEVLVATLTETDNVKITKYVDDGVGLFDLMKKNALEGVIGKNKNGIYREDKRDWIKVKTWQNGTFIAVGYTAGTGWRKDTFGALVLAGKNGYVGQVGTGFDNADLKSIMAMFSPGVCPFPKEPLPATWIKPFAVKIRYLEFTNDGVLRFPSFKGMA